MLELEEQLRRLRVEHECLKELSEGFRERCEQLERNGEERHAFIRNVSHELRSPLNSILILAEILGQNSQKNLTTKEVIYAETIHDSGHLLLDTISDLIDVAEAGTKLVPLQPVTIGIKKFLEARFLEEGLDGEVSVESDEMEIVTDAVLLHKVMAHAIKSVVNLSSSKRLNASVRRLAPNKVRDLLPVYPTGAVTAIVVSTGEGESWARPEDLIAELREMDGELRGEQLRLYMGMSIAKILAGGLRYSIEVDGSCCFALLIPDLPESGECGAGLASVSSTREIVPRLLLVEDEKVQRMSLCALLDRSPDTNQFRVDTAESADEGQFMLEKNSYACMIVDLGLRGPVSGLEFLRRLAAQDSDKVPPIIVYTGRVLAPDLEQELKQLADDVVVKGVDSPERLLEAVSNCAGSARKETSQDTGMELAR